jgi:protein SYS1
MLIVRRSSMVLDFVLTLQMFNLLFTWFYNGRFPASPYWWITKSTETIAMIFGGMYFCRMRELRPIAFSYELVPPSTLQASTPETQQREETVIVHENDEHVDTQV